MILKILIKEYPWKSYQLRKVFSVLLLSIGPIAFGQSFSDNLTQIREIPTTPTMWEFEKYGNYPVSMHTGVPNISIPLFTARSGELEIPVSISYHASGIKVDQKASWVGLGWSLMAGGAITRTVRGSVDERDEGYIDNTYYNQGQFDPAYSNNYYEMEEMLQGFIDTEPDIFQYSFMGYSGRFIFDHSTNRNTATIALIPHNDLIVKPTFSSTGQDIVSFTITTPEGYVAEFGYPERSSEYRAAGLIGSLTVTANSTWHLKKVTAPNGVDEISFQYKLVPGFHSTSSGMVQDERHSERESVNFYDPCNSSNYSGIQASSSNNGVVFYQVKRLERINFNNGYIYFSSSSGNRQDDPDNESLRLDEVQLYSSVNGTNTLIKRFQFQYGYFGSINTSNSTPDEYEVRLQLEQLTEKGSNGVSKNPYEFSYIEIIGGHGVPYRFSNAQDYWGYYNGKSNPSLVPSYTYQGSSNIYFGDANRDPDPNVSKIGNLERITFPTKGYTKFEYEGNTATIGTSEQQDAGGVRVKSIKSFDFDNSLQWQKSYEYIKPENSSLSSGIYNGTGFIDESDFRNVRTYHFKDTQVGSCPPNGSYYGYSTYTVSVSSYPTMANNTATVFYSNVKEYNGSLSSYEGYTWYEYAATKDYFSNAMGPISFRVDRSWDRGQLISKEVYENGNSNPVKTVTYNYSEVEVRSPISAFKPGTRFDVEGIGYYPPQDSDPYGFRSQQYFLAYYSEPIIWKRLHSKITEENGVTLQENYYYDNEIDHVNLAKTVVTDSKGNNSETEMYYPDDVNSTSAMEGGSLSSTEYSAIGSLKRNGANPRVGQVLQTVNTNNGKKSIERTNFKVWSNGSVLPSSVETLKGVPSGSNQLDERVIFNQYDQLGNLLEVSNPNGRTTSYIWGYNKEYPVAKVENADYIQINNLSGFGKYFDLGSGTFSSSQEATLRDDPSMSDALVTTYTYDPLVGVTSITDPRGDTTNYEYDEFNRLEHIKDANGNLVQEHKYNLKNQ